MALWAGLATACKRNGFEIKTMNVADALTVHKTAPQYTNTCFMIQHLLVLIAPTFIVQKGYTSFIMIQTTINLFSYFIYSPTPKETIITSIKLKVQQKIIGRTFLFSFLLIH